MTASKATSLYGTTKISPWKENLCIRKPGASEGYILYKNFLRILANIYLMKIQDKIQHWSQFYLLLPNSLSLSAIPKSLILKAMIIKKSLETITEESDVYQLVEGKTISLSKMRCKDYYSLFQVKWETQPTSVQSWSKQYPPPPSPSPTSQKCRQTIN